MTVQTRTKVELLPKITSCLVAVIRYDLLDANLDTRFLGPGELPWPFLLLGQVEHAFCPVQRKSRCLQ